VGVPGRVSVGFGMVEVSRVVTAGAGVSVRGVLVVALEPASVSN
jgi:hypothetical protein